MDSILYKKASQAADWLLPKKCLVCCNVNPNRDHPCCDECYQTLPFQRNCCQQCGQALAANQDYCGRCIESPPHFDTCFCPFEYESPISEQICALKYNQHPELAKSVAQLLAREIKKFAIELPEALIPVPLHISRLRGRGFNQSTLIARELGKLLQLPVRTNVVAKHRATQAQARQTLKQRKKNLRNSFKLKKDLRLQRVAIVDDVVTTGSTTGEIAKILKKNGVDYVQVWGVAHTL